MAQVKRCRFPEESKKSASFGGQNGQINRVRIGLRVSDISNADFPPKAAQRLGISPHTRISVGVLRYKKGRPSSGPVREDSLEQLFNVDALNTERGVQ